MKLLPGAIGVSLLLALLTWLLIRGIDSQAPAYGVTLRAFDDLALAEASLHRDVLQARVGLMRDYDTLVQANRAIEDAVARLRSYAAAEGLDTGPADRLAAVAAQQEELTERFKSTNAVLQNSLSYVGFISTNPSFGAGGGPLMPAAGALAAAILHLTRDTSPDAVGALQGRIDALSAVAPAAGPEVETARTLLAHARLLLELLPKVDTTLKALIAVPSGRPGDEIREQFAAHRATVETTAQHFRLLLYVVSIALVVMLVILGLQLRARALALRQRVAFEHVIAKNSTRLISCALAETDARLNQVLGDLCQAIGAERAYVVLDESPTRIYAWAADRKAYPPGWPNQALSLFAELGLNESEIVTIRDVTSMPAGSARDTLAAAGVQLWICVPLARPGRVHGIMGFDAVRPTLERGFPLHVVRLAGDVVANAIEREFLERDRVRLSSRLERARRLQVIGSLASGIAHNFNNLIGAILGYSEMIEPQLAPGTKPAQHIDEIRRAAERGRDLIENILTFGRHREGHVVAVQVRALFTEAASLLRASLPTDVELVGADVPPDLAVSGAPAQLQQVILNLCTNAAQAIGRNGCIRINAREEELDTYRQLSHGGLPAGRYVCLEVIDNGHGFEETVARRLFEPFFTTRLSGTGLGLATVLEIVRDYEGAMHVSSRPGYGSHFEVWLPAVAAEEGTLLGSAMLPLGRGETVLMVESDRERRLRDEEMLAALGYEPVGFEELDDAIAACRLAPDRFDLLLVSHTTPVPEGLEWARALHAIAPRHPILLLTATTVDGRLDALAQAGISEALRRPVAGTDLAAALARCLRTNGLLRP